jgi:RsmE family RNA methyltransferase
VNLILLFPEDALDESRYRLTDHRAEHIRSTLNADVGDGVEIGIVNGDCGTARVERISADEVILKIESLTPVQQPETNVDLICALPRPQTLKKLLITSAMMGVRELHLIRANRVEKSYYQSTLHNPGNYMPYLAEGLSQGKQTRLPAVTLHHRFRPFFEDFLPRSLESESNCLKLLPHPESAPKLTEIYDKAADHIILAIGPEGGWIPFEIELMESAGFTKYRMSRYVLRVEHAVTAALAQLELFCSAE